MKKCPMCNKWTLEYDSYFGRYRCFNSECEWMPKSSSERAISRLNSNRQPIEFGTAKIPDLGLTLTAAYDEDNDVLLFDFGIKEPTYDLPEPDGRVVWKIGNISENMAGFVILEAKDKGVSEVKINIKGRKENIEEVLKNTPEPFFAGRPTRTLIDKVELTVNYKETEDEGCEFRDLFSEFESRFLEKA